VTCQYKCFWLTARTRIWNDLLCIEWDVSFHSVSAVIGATTVGTGGDWSPQLLGWGDQQYIGPSQLSVVCSDVHVLRSPQMSTEATRMQDLASEFSKKIPGVIPPDPHSGRGDPPPALCPQPGLWPPVLGPKRWSPSTFKPWLRPWVL